MTWRKNRETALVLAKERRGCEGEGAEGPATQASPRAGADLVAIVPAEGTLAMPGTHRLAAQAKSWRERKRNQEPPWSFRVIQRFKGPQALGLGCWDSETGSDLGGPYPFLHSADESVPRQLHTCRPSLLQLLLARHCAKCLHRARKLLSLGSLVGRHSAHRISVPLGGLGRLPPSGQPGRQAPWAQGVPGREHSHPCTQTTASRGLRRPAREPGAGCYH